MAKFIFHKTFLLLCISFICSVAHAQIQHENATILEEKILVPNAFSPNGDGLNDEFRIFSKDDVMIASFIIINQHGEIVFQTSGCSGSWDGRYKGISAPEGNYMYMISFIVPGQEGIQSKKGSIMLIR